MRRIGRPWNVAILIAALSVTSLAAFPSAAIGAPTPNLLEGFEGDSGQWTRVAGAPTVTRAPALTEGASSFSLDYDLSGGTAEVERTVSNSPVLTAPSTSLTIDLKGDGSYNTVYLKLRDATGEFFMYRVDAMRSSSLYPVTIDLRKPAAGSSGGNADGVLDAPFVFSRVLVVRNGSQPARGNVTLDNLRETPSGWGLPAAQSPYFAPSKGESTTLAFTPGGAGDYSIALRDGEGRVRTLTGSTSGDAVAVPWDGLDDNGSLMRGNIKAVFQHDSTADGTLDALRTQTGIPLMTTVADSDPAGAVTSLVDGFESGAGPWSTTSGTATISPSLSNKTEGSSALRIDYDIRTSNVEVSRTPAQAVTSSPITALKVDLKGDASYNTVYMKLRDASGEDFVYRADAMRTTTWSTATMDLTKAPTASSGGDQDKVLDLPLTLRSVSVVRNGSQPATGSVIFDNIRAITTGWTTPTAATSFFTPRAGNPLALSFDAATPGDYSLQLRTSDGLLRTLAGTVTQAGPQTLTWDGSSDSGQAMSGEVSGIFLHDTMPDGSVSSAGSTQSGLPFVVTVAASDSASTLVDPFDTNDGRWVSTGTGSVVTSTSTDRTEGPGSLSLAYDVSAGNASLETNSTPETIATAPISSLMIDLKGDSSYNSVYVVLEDATGENFLYLTDALRLSRWATTTVDLTRPPAISRHGNSDGVLDYPLTLLGLNIARNGTAPATGSVLVDNLRVKSEGWSIPAAADSRFSSAAGETTTVSFTAGAPGDYALTLSDLSGHTKTFTGTASAAGPITVGFDGTDGSGEPMAGSVKAQLAYDTSPDGVLSSADVVASNPYTTGVTARASANEPRSIAGVNAFLTSLDDPAKADRQAALMEEASLRYDREEFEWKRVEPRKGFFDWAKFDQAVAITDARNVEMIGKLVYTAPWASSAPAGTPASDIEYYPPTNISDFTDYASAVVDRYKGKVHVWEVWNEPNTALYWKPGPDGQAYGQLLKATYAAIKASDPSATVLVGGLAGFDLSFMRGIESANAGSSYDGLAIHSYSKGAPTSGQTETWLDAAASYLGRTAPGRSLWITEVGWPTCTDCDGATSEADQATYLSQTYLDAAARGIAGITWYNLVGGDNPQARLDTFALTTKDGRKKPAYDVLKDIGAAFDGAESSGPAAATALDSSVRVNDLASTSGFTSAGISGGSARLSVTTSRHSGAGGFRLDYSYSGTSKGGQISTNQLLPGEPTAVSVWVYGDGSMSPIYLKLLDATGERFQALVGNSGVPGWKKMTLYSDGMNGNYTHAGGDNDGVWDYPMKLTDVFAYKGTSGITSGTIMIDDITADYGVNIHGTVLLNNEGSTQAVYTADDVQTSLPVTGSEASVTNADGTTSAPATGGLIDVDLGALPTFVASPMSVSAPAAGSGAATEISWIGGDRHRMTVQILTPSGVVIRTIVNQSYFDAGESSVLWDGRRYDGSVSPVGSYVAKVTLTPTEGEPISTTQSFAKQ